MATNRFFSGNNFNKSSNLFSNNSYSSNPSCSRNAFLELVAEGAFRSAPVEKICSYINNSMDSLTHRVIQTEKASSGTKNNSFTIEQVLIISLAAFAFLTLILGILLAKYRSTKNRNHDDLESGHRMLRP